VAPTLRDLPQLVRPAGGHASIPLGVTLGPYPPAVGEARMSDSLRP